MSTPGSDGSSELLATHRVSVMDNLRVIVRHGLQRMRGLVFYQTTSAGASDSVGMQREQFVHFVLSLHYSMPSGAAQTTFVQETPTNVGAKTLNISFTSRHMFCSAGATCARTNKLFRVRTRRSR